MIITILRCLIIYLIALLIIRVMGKRQIAQMQPFELVITLIIADLATVPMADVSIPLFNGILPLMVLAVLHFFITLLSCKSLRIRCFFNGRPIILVTPNGIDESALKKMNVTINDVLEACRYAGYVTLEDVQYVIMETNGNISVIPKSSATEVTREDLKIKQPDPILPMIIISDGKFSDENLKSLNLTRQDIEEFLEKQKCKSTEVIIMTYSTEGDIYFQSKNESKVSLNQLLGQGGAR